MFCAFCADLMDFSVQLKVTNQAYAYIEIIPYTDNESFETENDNKVKELDFDDNMDADVCRVRLTTNMKAPNTIRFCANALTSRENGDTCGYSLFMGLEAGDSTNTLVVTSESTLDDGVTYTDVPIVVPGFGRKTKDLYVSGNFSALDDASDGTYYGTIQVEVIAD